MKNFTQTFTIISTYIRHARIQLTDKQSALRPVERLVRAHRMAMYAVAIVRGPPYKTPRWARKKLR